MYVLMYFRYNSIDMKYQVWKLGVVFTDNVSLVVWYLTALTCFVVCCLLFLQIKFRCHFLQNTWTAYYDKCVDLSKIFYNYFNLFNLTLSCTIIIAISCDSTLSKTHICLSWWSKLPFYVCVMSLSVCCSPSCIWPGTWQCQFWDITTTSSLRPIFWTLPWALRHFEPSSPLSHTMGSRCVPLVGALLLVSLNVYS